MDTFADLETHPYLTAERFYAKTANLLSSWSCTNEATSVLQRPIRFFQKGKGATRIIIWTQMHGNESTASFALSDLLLWLNSHPSWEEKLTIGFIPILNPDGAEAFTRTNALGVDINRDAPTLCTPEAKFLMDCVEVFQPHWAFNMHDQRSIFSVGNTPQPAVMALLAPNVPPDYTGNTQHRDLAMGLIGAQYRQMSDLEKLQTSRFSDEYYPLAMGDFMQTKGISTILVESGGGEIFRHKARMRTAVFLKNAIHQIAADFSFQSADKDEYLSIKENQTSLRDVIFRNVMVAGRSYDYAFQIGYDCRANTFFLELDTVGTVRHLHAYRTIDLHFYDFEIHEVPRSLGRVHLPEYWLDSLKKYYPDLWNLLA